MLEKKAQVLFCLLSLTALGCSGGLNLREKIPDRRPDYRQSSTSHRLEVPPDLVGSSLHDQLTVPAISGENSISYQDYNLDRYPRNQRGYLDVLPPLEGVEVIEKAGTLPYLLVNADANSTWRAVKKYWLNSGIRLKVEEPAIGLMETDWLEDISKLPKTGIGGFLDDLIQFTHDSGTRDRYRIRFTRAGNNQTQVTLIYTQAEEKALGARKDPEGFAWTVSDNDNPELQLEMTRRLAVFIASDLRRQQQRAAPTAQNAQLSSINGQPALVIKQNYATAWQNLSFALEKAGFLLEHQDYKNGSYQVSVSASSSAENGGLLSRVFGSKNEEKAAQQYIVRLASQGDHSIVVVQNLQYEAEAPQIAQDILSRLQMFL